MQTNRNSFTKKVGETIKLCFKSIYNSLALFKLRKKSFITALGVLVITIFLSTMPSFLKYANEDGTQMINRLPRFENAMNHIFLNEDYKIDCEIKDNLLVCDEGYSLEKIIVTPTGANTDVKYNLIVNTTMIDNEATFEGAPENENFIYFGREGFIAKYVVRDHTKEEVNPVYIRGDYSLNEGFNFKEAFERTRDIETDDDRGRYASILSITLVSNIIKSSNKQQFIGFLTMISTAVVAFVLISSFILKGYNLFNKGKGFKFKETLKIACFATLQPLVIAYALLIVGLDYTMTFSFAYLFRIAFLYFRYITSKKSNLFDLIATGEV